MNITITRVFTSTNDILVATDNDGFGHKVVGWGDTEGEAEFQAKLNRVQDVIDSNVECGADDWGTYGDTVQDGLNAHFVNVIDTLGVSFPKKEDDGYVYESVRLAHYKAVANLHAAFAAACARKNIIWS